MLEDFIDRKEARKWTDTQYAMVSSVASDAGFNLEL
jgi:hypothetical protein